MPTKTPNKEDLPLPKPEQITIAWLKQHVPVGWWKILLVSLIPVVLFVFSLGVIAGNWEPISAWVTKDLEKSLDTSSPKENVDDSDSENVPSLSLRDHLREIRDIVNCRIDLSSKFAADNFRSPQEAARAQRIHERNAMLKRLLMEINRFILQIEQISSTRDIGGNLPPVSPDELNRCLRTVDTR